MKGESEGGRGERLVYVSIPIQAYPCHQAWVAGEYGSWVGVRALAV